MLYHVKAKYIEEKLSEFYSLLTSGEVEKLHTAGSSIVKAMLEDAVETEPGTIEWTEKCFCETPLELERDLVFDTFLTDMETAPVEDSLNFSGTPFSEILKKNA